MRDTMRIAVIFCLALGFVSCNTVRGSGKKADETRHVPAFSELVISGGYEMEINVKPGKPETVALHMSGDDNLLPLIETEVSGDRLTIDSDKSFWTELPLAVRMAPGELSLLKINGSGEIVATGISGKKFVLEVNGSGELELSGKVETLEIEVNGSGEIKARNLQADNVIVDISGSGELEVCASEALEADVAGSGTVIYHCNPAEVKQNITGSGELVKK